MEWRPGSSLQPTGRIDRVIEMPIRNPTCVAFGGTKLDTLYITTARYLIQPHELEAEPLAGALFAVSPGVTGVDYLTRPRCLIGRLISRLKGNTELLLVLKEA